MRYVYHAVMAFVLNKVARFGSKLMSRAGTASNVHELKRDRLAGGKA